VDSQRIGADVISDADDLEFYRTVAALLPMPVFVFSESGDIVVSSMAAAALLCTSPDDDVLRPRTFDGMDLWELLPSAITPGARTTRMRERMRLTSGETVETNFWIVPSWDAGVLVGALVIAGDIEGSSQAGQRRSLVSMAGDEDALLHSAVTLMESALAADVAYVAEIDPVRQGIARTLCVSHQGVEQEDYEWSLSGTPASVAYEHHVVMYEQDVAELFPKDTWLADAGLQSYAGAGIFDPLGRRIGIVAGLWHEPFIDGARARSTLGLLAALVAPTLWQRRSQADLVESEARYSSLFQQTRLPMMVIDLESSQMVEVNKAACTFYGYSAEELSTMSIFQIDTLPAAHVLEELQRGVEGTRDYFQTKHQLADGAVRDVEVYVGPITMHGHKLLYAIVHDVSDKRRAESELEHYRQNLETLVQQRTRDLFRANKEIKEATRARDSFFSNAGHELRTPLYTVIGITDMMLGGLVGELDDEQRKQLAMVSTAGRDVLDLVSDLLDISLLQTGISPCEPEVFDLDELLAATMSSMQSTAEMKKLELRLDVDQYPVQVTSDRYKVQQILMNLISNALKHAQSDAVTISVRKLENLDVAVAVADNGPGISEEELPHVFDEFRHIDGGESSTRQGSGLGLALSSRLASALGATLQVQSSAETGAVFTLTLPANPPGEGIG